MLFFVVKSKEEEVKKMREELSGLRGEESELEDKVEASRRKLDEMKRSFAETSSIISQVRYFLFTLKALYSYYYIQRFYFM